jgi:hypothetical protein
VTAGYSGTPLPKKLGLKPDQHVVIVDEPPDFRSLLGNLPIRFSTEPVDHADIVIAFATERVELDDAIQWAAAAVFPSGAIWAAWPKKASKVPTDITEDTVREIALPMGLVDNKVCAIDAIWSGLRIVWRKDRRT